MKDERLPRLVLQWSEAPSPPDAQWWWGQMASGLHRLGDVRERMESVSRMRHAQRALVEFTAALELSWWHCYSVRERAVEFLGVTAGDKGAAGRLKKPSARCAALVVLSGKDRALTECVKRLVVMLDATVGHRNRHTHGNYVGLAFDIGHDSFGPEDVINYAGAGAKGKQMRAVVAGVIRRKARACASQMQDVVVCLSDLLTAGAPARGGRRSGSPGLVQAAFP